MQVQASSTTNDVQVNPLHTIIQSVSSSASLQCVSTLLRAGLGCIAYLRQTFSCYLVDHLSAEIKNALSTGTSGSFSTDGQVRRTISGVTIMNLKRGFTNEGDKILDYLEHGIFEAIEKQYLRRFIFAIYLDGHDPNNIIEAYTFNFQYHKVPGTDTVVPIMSLGDQLSKMCLGSSGGRDPLTDALKRGKVPTLGEVKRSLKLMIKTLVTTISHMESLPKSRFGNFKLFFNENTPDDYQPPHFRAGDVDSHKWFFTTHGTSEVPERMSIGNLETGWHGVNMNVTSISSFLPSVIEDNNAMFTGITANSGPKLSPVEEALLRSEDAELQRKDALNRSVVWDADVDEDADGEETIDEGIVLTRYNGISTIVPVGVRGDDGVIQPILVHDDGGGTSNSVRFDGVSQRTPTSVGKLMIPNHMEDTQVIPDTQEVQMRTPSPPGVHQELSLPSSNTFASTISNLSTPGIDTQLLEEKLRKVTRDSVPSDTDMLDMETQASIFQEPFIAPETKTESDRQKQSAPRKTKASVRKGVTGGVDEGKLDCECGTTIEDALIFCEGGCKKWYHIWCVGYHGLQDNRLPEQFICFDCRLRKSHEWDIIAGKIHADIKCRFQELALFRGVLRAIKIFELQKPKSVMKFREQIGCTAALAGQLLARLEDEAFIATESEITDNLGTTREITTKKGKKQARSGTKKAQKELQRTKYVFLHASKRGRAYRDYFNPDPQVENHLMGLADKVRTRTQVGGEETLYFHIRICLAAVRTILMNPKARTPSISSLECQMKLPVSTSHRPKRRLRMY
ncbi:HORMA domain-containing protein [Scleroderma yunnanense]